MYRASKLLFSLILLGLLLIVIPLSAAQETFGLSSEDFQLLTTANTTTAAASSYEFTFTVNAATKGVPDGDFTAALNGTGAIIQGATPGFQLAVTGTVIPPGASALPIDVQLRLVDNVIYYNVVDPTTGQSTGWAGQSVEDFGSTFAQGFNQNSSVPLDPALLSGDTSSLGDLSPLFTALSAVNPGDYIAITRVGNENIGGADTIHFSANLGVTDFLKSDAFEQIISAAAQMSPENTETPGEAQLAAVAAMVGVAFEGTTLSFDEYVGAADNMIHRAVLDLNLAVDPAQFGQTEIAPITFALNFDVSLNNFNGVQPITAPEGAIVTSASSTSALDQPTVVPSAASASQPIVPNTPLTVQLIGNFKPVDLVYTAPEPQIVNVYLRSATAGQIDTVLEIVDSTGEVINRNDDHTTTRANLAGRDSAIEGFALPAAGDYIIRVNSFDGQTVGPVEVTLEVGNPIVASPVAVTTSGDVFTLNLNAGSPATQTISVTAGEILTITARDTSGTLDPKVTLMDSSGNVLAENDDHGSGDTTLDSLDSRITSFTAPSSGNYTVQVSDFFNNAGTAEVTIQRGSAPVLAATPIPTNGEVIQGNLVASGRFSQPISLSAGEVVTITVRDTSGTLDTRITLRDPNGVVVAENDDHASGDTSLDQFDSRIQNYVAPQAGTYTIEVVDVYAAAGSFEMTISR